MPTELEELVEFLHHGNTQIRQAAVENLLPYSKTFPSIFKANKLTPIKDLKLLIKSYPPTAKYALTILINVSKDQDVLKDIANDGTFLESLLLRITNVREPNVDEMCMLLANMAKSDSIERILTLKRDVPLGLSTSKLAIDQLMDCFVKGAKKSWNPNADYDYLAYLFADLAKFRSGANYLTHTQPYDTVIPLSKLLPFTPPSSSLPRRLGVSTAIKNVSLHPITHPTLLHSPLSIYPYLLLPLASGTDTYSPDETDKLPDELQLLEPETKRESDVKVLKMYLEALLLLCTEREGRDMLREIGGYYVVRECHLAVEDEGVREGCERLVQVLMRDEEGEEGMEVNARERQGRGEVVRGRGDEEPAGRMVTQADLEESDEDEKVVEIF